MSAGAQTVKNFAKSEFFDLKVFPKSVFKKFPPPTPPRTPPRTPPWDASGGTTGGLRPQLRHDAKSKRRRETTAKSESGNESDNPSHTLTGRRIFLSWEVGRAWTCVPSLHIQPKWYQPNPREQIYCFKGSE